MASDAVIDRIVKLLRLAADQEDTPEGRNAAMHAQRLMEQHAVFVVLEDVGDNSTPLEVVDVFGTFIARELWIEGISHLVGYIYDTSMIWQATPEGKGVALFGVDLTGDRAHLAAAKRTFESLLAFVRDEPLPRSLLHHLPSERARFIFRAGVANALITRLSRSKVERIPRDELTDSSSETALVHVAVHRRPRSPFVDALLDVPVQGDSTEFETGPEAALFAWGMHAGKRAFLPPLARVTDE